MTRIGKVQLPPFEPILGAPEDRFYRNKLEYTFSTKEFTPGKPSPSPGPFPKGRGTDSESTPPSPGEGGREDGSVTGSALPPAGESYDDPQPGAAGFHARGFFEKVVAIEKCWLQEDVTNRIRNGVRDFARANGHDLDPQVYTGKGFAIEQLEDFRFKIGPKSFFQTNTKQAEHLYRVTREFAELDGSQVLYDLYCGTGSIGIFCSRGAKKIVGVELIEAAIADAKENAALNNIGHSFFTAGDVIDVCDDAFFAEHGRPDVLITDPPRAGMHEKLVHKILEMEAPTVVYVSCNPATQARDLALLDAKYAVTRVRPVDMFPHTHHIENVVQLKRRSS
ncbi:MAG: class I SAM-dependent RNA methyltransferase [Chitinophagaceae bacterium]|nr:MAG: class I SAM-dependent RNA methyltransferase [Chitinophagaceae bacterium]